MTGRPYPIGAKIHRKCYSLVTQIFLIIATSALVVNTRIQPSLNILELLFDKTISQPKLILKGLFGTKIVHMPIQPSLNILQLLFDRTIREPEFFLNGLFGTKIVPMQIQPRLNILQLLFDSTISEPEPVSHAKWAFMEQRL